MTYKALIPVVSGIAIEFPEFAHGEIRVLAEPGTQRWVPPQEWWDALARLVPPGQTVFFRHRPDAAYHYRAFNNGDNTTIYVDETETPESVRWVLLHEMAHATINRLPSVARHLRKDPKPKNYATDDHVHASVPEEIGRAHV